MQLIQVTDINTAKQFLQVAVQLYKEDPHWIRAVGDDLARPQGRSEKNGGRLMLAAKDELVTPLPRPRSSSYESTVL